VLQVMGIRMPFSFGNLDRDKTSQALLLARAVESGELAPDCDSRGRNRVLDGARPWTTQVGLHRMNIVVVAPSRTRLRFSIVCR
jgi:hypothetical protein